MTTFLRRRNDESEPFECPQPITCQFPQCNCDRMKRANERLGFWMAAALDDPNVCDEMKADIRTWFEAQ